MSTAGLAACAVLAACGNNDESASRISQSTSGSANHQPAPVGDTTDDRARGAGIAVRLTEHADDNAQPATKATGDNLLDLSDRWFSWTGEVSPVAYDARNQVLRLPGDRFVRGVRRYDLALVAGQTYTFSVQSDEPRAMAGLFMFDQHGRTDLPGFGILYATAANPRTFVAPANVAGFFVQVQNLSFTHNTLIDRETTMTAQLREQSNTGGGANLIALNGIWPDWVGRDSGVTYDESDGQLLIPAPAPGQGNRFGIRRYPMALTPGVEYELMVPFASDPHASLLLFLIDSAGRFVPFADGSAPPRPWLTARSGNGKRFVAPSSISRIVIQVQSAWLATTPTRITAALREVLPDLACTPRISPPVSLAPAIGSVYPWASGVYSDDGSTIAFSDGQTEIVPGIVEPNDFHADVYLFDVASGIIEPVTGGAELANSNAVSTSADGRYTVFQSEASRLIPGEVDANGDISDLFLFDRMAGRIERVTPGTGRRPALAPRNSPFSSPRAISGDGQTIVFRGSPAELIPGDPSTCTTCVDGLIYDRASRKISRIVPFDASNDTSVAAHPVISANDRFVAFSSHASDLIPGDPDRNGNNSDVFILDRQSSKIERVSSGGENPSAVGFTRQTISADGRYVAFDTSAETVVPGFPRSEARWDIYLVDRAQNLTTRISDGAAPGGWHMGASISTNGEAITFRSAYANHPITDARIHVYHRASRSLAVASPEPDRYSHASLSGDGSKLMYMGGGLWMSDVQYPCAQ